MRLGVRGERRVRLIVTLATAAALAWALAHSAPLTGSPVAPWPAAGLPGWPVALLL
jgi:hypothetical protein